MAILAIGSAGTIGSKVVAELSRRGASVVALVHKKEADFPTGVKRVKADLTA